MLASPARAEYSLRMAGSELADIEELALCSCCKRAFDDDERPPKLLACQHHFCLECARGVLCAGRDVCCMHCCKRTALPVGGARQLPTHAPVLALARRLAPGATCAVHALPALWCCACAAPACRACVPHATHTHALRPPHEARALMARAERELREELARLAARRRDLQLRALEAATALKLRLERELAAPALPAAAPRDLAAAAAECERLRAQHAVALLQGRLDELVRAADVLLEPSLIRRALAGGGPAEAPGAWAERRDPLLLLANYCSAQLFARQLAERRAAEEVDAAGPSPGASSSSLASPARAPGLFPLVFLDLMADGAACGRVLVELRDDVAPRMAHNFLALAGGELGVGYRGCSVFQCWQDESVITGDFELNNGRGGRSVFEESYFMPDDTRLAAVRGAVGMRRSQKRHDQLGLVGSQFRIVLREMRGFTAIFAFVVEGLELVDRLSRTGDSAGKPHSTIIISNCGKFN